MRRRPGPVAAAEDALGVFGGRWAYVDDGIQTWTAAWHIAGAIDIGDPFRDVAAEVPEAGGGDVL